MIKLEQELNQEYLENLCERLIFEIEIRYLIYDDAEEGNPWLQPMYLIPMWNIVEKLKKFKPYFHELDIKFPTMEVYRQPMDFSTVFPSTMIRSKEEELIFKGEKIRVKYNYII